MCFGKALSLSSGRMELGEIAREGSEMGPRGCVFPNPVGNFCFPGYDEEDSGRVEAQRSKKSVFPFAKVPVGCRLLLGRELTGKKKYRLSVKEE